MAVEVLTVGDLGQLGDQLGAGAQAVIFDAPALRLPHAPGRLVYKEYKPGAAPRLADMDRLIDLRARLDEHDRTHLDTIATWPQRAVVDAGGALRGVVLPRIPDSFFQPVTLPSSGLPATWVREVQHLFVDPARCRRVGMPDVTWEQRLTICRDFAAALDFLHGPAINVTFGDINAKNELFRVDGAPTVMFVDCDAVRRHGFVTGQPMLNAPDWEPPHQTSLNQSTDRYKLGLFVLRCLTDPGPQASVRTDPADVDGVLDATGRALLMATLRGYPADRPSANDWLRYLSLLLGQPLDPPTLTDVAPDRTLVPAGEPVTVHWSTTGAVTVEVSAPGVDPVVSDGRPGFGRTRICPVRTGPLLVTARNPHGTDAVRTPPIGVFDLPSWSSLPVPAPALPVDRLPLPDLPDVGPVLAMLSVPDAAPASIMLNGPDTRPWWRRLIG